MELGVERTDRITRLGLATIRQSGVDVVKILNEHMLSEHGSETGRSEFKEGWQLNERHAHEFYLVDQFISGKEIKF